MERVHSLPGSNRPRPANGCAYAVPSTSRRHESDGSREQLLGALVCALPDTMDVSSVAGALRTLAARDAATVDAVCALLDRAHSAWLADILIRLERRRVERDGR